MAFCPPHVENSRRIQQQMQQKVSKEMRDLQSCDDLFCLKCIKQGKYTAAFGFCKVCRDFLCSPCVDKHESTLMTLNHGIVTGSELIDRYQHAIRKDKRISPESSTRLSLLANYKVTLHYKDETKTKKQPAQFTKDKIKDSSTITDTRVKLATDLQKCFICACIILSDGTVILADANNKNIKLFDKFFQWLSVFQMKKEPWDMCASMDRSLNFHVTESLVKGVHLFRAGNEIQYVLTLKTDGNCFGVASWGEGVAVSVKKGGKYEIQLIDKYGNMHVCVKDGPELSIRTPWYLTSLRSKPLIVVSDSEARTVSGINYEGQVEFVYKKKHELGDPRNVAADDDGYIYVIDYERDTLRQITQDGQDRGAILCRNNGLRSPSGLACNGHMLYIQAKMDSTNIQVFLLK